MSIYANQDIFARINEEIIFCPNKESDEAQDKATINQLIVDTEDQAIKKILLKYSPEGIQL